MNRSVVVIGAGLGGLVAAARAASHGRKVTVVDRLNRIGGVCGEWTLNGATYVRGSVEFMSGLYRGLEQIGVKVPFRPVRSRYYFGDQTFTLPPRLQEIPFWAKALPGLAIAAWNLKVTPDGSLAGALTGRSTATKQCFGALLQQGGLRFEDIQAEDARAMARYALEDGLHQPAMVEGGPQRLVDALVERCQQNGVQFRLGVEIHKVEPGRIETSAGVMEADATLSCRPRWHDWTGPSSEALALGQVLLHVREIPQFPDHLDTIYRLPFAVEDWHASLTAGKWPEELGWSLLNPRLGETPERRTLVGYLPVPAGIRTGGGEILERLLPEMEKLIPGLKKVLLAAHLLLPDAYRSAHGLEPVPALHLPVGPSRRPSYRNQQTGELHMGPSVEPPSLYGASVVRRALAIAEEIV